MSWVASYFLFWKNLLRKVKTLRKIYVQEQISDLLSFVQESKSTVFLDLSLDKLLHRIYKWKQAQLSFQNNYQQPSIFAWSKLFFGNWSGQPLGQKSTAFD